MICLKLMHFSIWDSSFYTGMLGNNAPETVAYLMESHHHERLKMVFGDKYNAMKRHIKK